VQIINFGSVKMNILPLIDIVQKSKRNKHIHVTSNLKKENSRIK